MILIADGGSTKTSWCTIDREGMIREFETEGYNPFFVDSTYILESLNINVMPRVNAVKITEVYFYGAGCAGSKTDVMQEVLQKTFVNANVQTNVDLLAAARALLGRQRGFAAILGTGTNTCIYDGSGIEKNVDSLGFILGDEGSGGHIGKKLLSDYLRGEMPEPLAKLFTERYLMTDEEIIDRVYTAPMANRFCAGFCRFIAAHIDQQYMQSMVRSSFQDFFRNLVSKYPNYRNYKFNCIGSIGYIFKPILEEVAREFDMETGLIIQSPIQELINYHIF